MSILWLHRSAVKNIIENRQWKRRLKETTTWTKIKMQVKTTNRSLTQRENPIPVGGLHITPKQYCIRQYNIINDVIIHFRHSRIIKWYFSFFLAIGRYHCWLNVSHRRHLQLSGQRICSDTTHNFPFLLICFWWI